MLVDVTDDVADYREGVAKLRASGVLDNDTWSEVWELDGLESMLFQRIVLGTPILGFDPDDEIDQLNDLWFLRRLRVVAKDGSAAQSPAIAHDDTWMPRTDFVPLDADPARLDLRGAFLFATDEGAENDRVMTVCVGAPEEHAALLGTAVIVAVGSATFWLDEPDEALVD